MNYTNVSNIINFKDLKLSDLDSKYIYPGDVCVSKSEIIYNTILGSCISVCLYDIVSGVGGINHFMLPNVGKKTENKSRYGDYAIKALLLKMSRYGAKFENIRAKFFGGASQFKSDDSKINIGRRNIDVALFMLKKYKIPIENVNIGGDVGRKILFLPHSGIVYLKFLSTNSFYKNIVA